MKNSTSLVLRIWHTYFCKVYNTRTRTITRTRFVKAWFTIPTIFRLNFLWAKCFKKVLTDYAEKLHQTLGKHVLCRKNALEIIKKNTHVGVLHYHITLLKRDSTTDAFSIIFLFFFGRGMAAIFTKQLWPTTLKESVRLGNQV